ncbi:MAG: TldD/PmbA family protein [Thermoleophilia bacterium]|nr:TldD/PmbA family protein [Thermoleophilia bacterium]
MSDSGEAWFGRQSAPYGARSALAIAKAVLTSADKTRADFEAYVTLARTVEIKAYGGRVESLLVAEPRGVGVRAMRDGRTGYAYTTDLSDAGLHRVAAAAAAAMAAGDRDPIAGLPPASEAGYPEIPGLWSPSVSATSLEAKCALVLEAEAAAASYPFIHTVEQSVYVDEEEEVAVASTAGVEVSSRRSFCFLYVWAHAGQGDDRQSGIGFTCGRGVENLEARAAGEEAARKAAALLGGKSCPTGAYTVVFAPEVTAALVVSIARALTADAVQKGRSVFVGKRGEMLGSSCLSLTDDGLAPEGMATNPFDAEGTPAQSTWLIRDGKLVSYLYDWRTAWREGEGAKSTGNAVRHSYRTLPVVQPTNIVVEPGVGDLSDLLVRVGEGLYIESVVGLNSGVNTVTGEISVGAAGRKILGGELVEPVREITVATDFATLLRSVVDLGGDARWIPLYGSVKACSMAVSDVVVSGR